MKIEANIGGMDCGNCAAKIQRAVESLDDVEAVEVNLTFAKLQADVGDEETAVIVQDAVEQLGYTYEAKPTGAPSSMAERPALHRDLHFLVVAFGALSTIAAVIATHGFDAETVGIALYLLGVVGGGVYVFRNAFTSLRHLHLDINVLMTIAVIGAIALGEWFEAATVVVLFAFAEWLEGLSMARARGAIRELMDLAPPIARVRRDDGLVEVPAEQVRVGEIVDVRPGERLPLDGTVVEGRSAVDQSAITGESIPVTVGAGDEVFAGSMNDRGHIAIEVTAAASDSTIAHVLRAIEDAQKNRAESERFIERFTRWYTPAVVAIAAAVALLPPLFVGDAEGWFYRALVLLVIACPCALVIATPITTVSALARSARDGVLVKGGRYLEALADVRSIIFDKTGTLTRAELTVGEIVVRDRSPEEVLGFAASVEQRSEHFLGRAVVAAAQKRGVSMPSVRDFVAHAGEGVEAFLGEEAGCGSSCGCDSEEAVGDRVVVGAQRLFSRLDIDASEWKEDWHRLEQRGSTVIGVAIDDELIGLIECVDEPRAEAREALIELQKLGVERLEICTGDNRFAAASLAEKVGVPAEWVHAELMPEDKVAMVVRRREENGAVAMVGDGINDAPALASADVGIAMGAAGTDVALETAHVALMGDDLLKLSGTLRLARSTVRKIRQNVALALGIKLAVLALAVAGYATIWMAIAADMGTSLLVIANGMRLLRE